MKKILLIGLLALFGCKKEEVLPITENPQANPNNIIVIIGQSNADGNAAVAGFSSYLQTSQPTKIYYKSDGNDTTNNGQWQNMVIGTNTQNPNGTQGGKSGFEAPLSYKLKNTYGKNVAIIKAAWGGSSLGNTVAPTWKHTINGNLYDRMRLSYINCGMSSINNPKISCVIWNQGETDATSSGFASNYEANLTSLILKFRSDYGSNIPFIIHKLKDLTLWGAAYWSQVRQAQINVASSMQNVYIIDCDSYSFAGDNVHYTAPSLESIGNATADKVIQINCLR